MRHVDETRDAASASFFRLYEKTEPKHLKSFVKAVITLETLIGFVLEMLSCMKLSILIFDLLDSFFGTTCTSSELIFVSF